MAAMEARSKSTKNSDDDEGWRCVQKRVSKNEAISQIFHIYKNSCSQDCVISLSFNQSFDITATFGSIFLELSRIIIKAP